MVDFAHRVEVLPVIPPKIPQQKKKDRLSSALNRALNYTTCTEFPDQWLVGERQNAVTISFVVGGPNVDDPYSQTNLNVPK
jgi:hypothetical protein